jgi:alginate O-acetyltransferase complex protein AlgJ
VKTYKFKKLLKHMVCLATLSVSVAHAADPASVLVGKDDWLFTPFEFATPSDATDTDATVQLFQKVNKLFEKKGIALTLVIVPSKIRIHSDKLPDSKPLDSYTAEKYDNAIKALRDGGVNTVNLNQAFLASPNRSSDTPLFLRLDTHWSPAGAMLAAETIKNEIDGNPVLKTALASTAEEKFTLTWNEKQNITRARDLVKYLPAGTSFSPERILSFNLARAQTSQSGLLSAGDNVEITVIGSSYTHKNTGYPDALRYFLQRNLLDISIPVDQGPWVGMEAYLKDESFITKKPKLIIWEIPERELRSPPNAKYRAARYVMENNEWISKVSALLK